MQLIPHRQISQNKNQHNRAQFASSFKPLAVTLNRGISSFDEIHTWHSCKASSQRNGKIEACTSNTYNLQSVSPCMERLCAASQALNKLNSGIGWERGRHCVYCLSLFIFYCHHLYDFLFSCQLFTKLGEIIKTWLNGIVIKSGSKF